MIRISDVNDLLGHRLVNGINQNEDGTYFLVLFQDAVGVYTELLIRRCAEVAEKSGAESAKEAAEAILKHFIVESSLDKIEENT